MKRQSTLASHQNPQKPRTTQRAGKICRYFATREGCKQGDKCPFVHLEQLEPAVLAKSTTSERSYRSKRFLQQQNGQHFKRQSSSAKMAIKPYLDTSADSIERVSEKCPSATGVPEQKAMSQQENTNKRVYISKGFAKRLQSAVRSPSDKENFSSKALNVMTKSVSLSKRHHNNAPPDKRKKDRKTGTPKKSAHQQNGRVIKKTPAVEKKSPKDEKPGFEEEEQSSNDENISTPTSPAGTSETEGTVGSDSSSTIPVEPVDDISSPYDYPLAGEESTNDQHQNVPFAQHFHPQQNEFPPHMMYYAAPPMPHAFYPPQQPAFYAPAPTEFAPNGGMLPPPPQVMYPAAAHPQHFAYYHPQPTSVGLAYYR
eukprot:CAMPEP_0117451554 /NCGR_PEP_ID=MMETSP0759-20121206/9073_1 /TAXON_ID=63605 /ORGANISM="Percolomonas cosmopolitus, Strain WS" /LENGTH=368 /DNA_ID=CAMNT_0005244169 /DNA_START=86 /DNA_END=1192 /DNA_ORIENTATION=-